MSSSYPNSTVALPSSISKLDEGTELIPKLGAVRQVRQVTHAIRISIELPVYRGVIELRKARSSAKTHEILFTAHGMVGGAPTTVSSVAT
jgi:hypothetical protein